MSTTFGPASTSARRDPDDDARRIDALASSRLGVVRRLSGEDERHTWDRLRRRPGEAESLDGHLGPSPYEAPRVDASAPNAPAQSAGITSVETGLREARGS